MAKSSKSVKPGSKPAKSAKKPAPTKDQLVKWITNKRKTKKGKEYICLSPEPRLPEAEFKVALSKAREFNGWYAAQWEKMPGGFGFFDKAQAKKFLEEV